MDKVFFELRNGTWGITKTDYDALELDGTLKKASGLPEGCEAEVFDESTGKVTAYLESFGGHLFER